MVNVCYESSYISKDIWQCLINNQIAHYFVNGSDFDIKILHKTKCLICISKCPLLLKHPVAFNGVPIVHIVPSSTISWALHCKQIIPAVLVIEKTFL